MMMVGSLVLKMVAMRVVEMVEMMAAMMVW